MKSLCLTFSFFLQIVTSASETPNFSPNQKDPYLWLEEILGPKAMDFVKNENQKTLSILKNDPHYKEIENEINKIFLAKDRIALATPIGKYLYNFWQDEVNPKGKWRRTTFKSYQSSNPDWELVLDLDLLSRTENENWVFKNETCLPPEYTRCLISLSRGGKDAAVIREFDLVSKSFIKDGFFVPEAKSSIHWIDQDHVYIGSDFGADSMTDSGYPKIIKRWQRGQPLSEAKTILEVNKEDISAEVFISRFNQKNYHFYYQNLTFYDSKIWYVEKNIKTLLPLPTNGQFYGYFKDYLLFQLRSNLVTPNQTFYKSGSIVALPFNKITEGDLALNELELIFSPTETVFVKNLSITKNHLLLEVLDNVKGKIKKISYLSPHQWRYENIEVGDNGVTSIYFTEENNDSYLLTYTDFLTPTSLYLGDANSNQKDLTVLKKGISRFDESTLLTEQFSTISKDGTIIPYFIVHKKNWKKDGTNPTLMYGYGGFEISLEPNYLGSTGKVWSEKGGVYVLASIRGGGEFGPAWHDSVVKENRQKVFDDFIAVAEDLINKKITSPLHLGIEGGSNGGLLVAATFIQRPELFNAVLCEVPLLDMLRYHKLLAGASWVSEYGDPDDPKMAEVIKKYSPYQNVILNRPYPEVFFTTSTKDDRVHPGHARKMVAKMKELNYQLFYYENIDGGHSGEAGINQSILNRSLELTYLWRKLR